MPTVPRYVQTETPKGYVTGQGFSGQGAARTADAWGRLGNALGQAGDRMFGIALAERDRMDKAVCEEAQNAYEDIMQTAKQAEEQRRGKNALGDDEGQLGVHETINQTHAKTVESILEGKNDRQKAYLQDYFAKRGRSFGDWGFEHERRERGVYEEGQAKAFQQTQINRAINNPGELEAAMGNMAQSIIEYNRSHGVADEMTQLQIQAGWDKMGKSIVSNALSRDDIGTASSVLRKYGDQFSAELVAEMRERIKNKQDVLQAKARAAAERAERAREKAAAEAVQARATEMAAGYADVYRALPSEWSDDQKAAHMTKLIMDGVKDEKALGLVMKSMKTTMDRTSLYEKAGNVEEDRRADEFLRGVQTVQDVWADGSVHTRPMSAAEQMRAIDASGDLSDKAKAMAKAKVVATPEAKAEASRISSDGLANFRSWFDMMGGNVSEEEARAKMFELGVTGKDVDSALSYRGKHLEYSMERVRGLVKTVTGANDNATVSKYYSAIMQDPRVMSGESLKDSDIRSIIFRLSAKGEVRQDGTSWFSSTPKTSRSGSSYLDAVNSGNGSRFSLEIPDTENANLGVEAETIFGKAYTSASDEVKVLVRETLWNRKQGIVTSFTERETQMLERAGLGTVARKRGR